MKNKTLKNLIALGAFALFVVGVHSASAQDIGLRPYSPSMYSYNYASAQPYSYVSSQAQQQIQYIEQPAQIQYITQPAQQTVQYVPVETIKYVNGSTTNTSNTKTTTTSNTNSSTQGASVARAGVVSKVNTTTNSNTGVNRNSGQYVNYDANQNMMLSNAYGVYNGQQSQTYDSNGVAALTIGGTRSFMPSSVFQWFMLILLILAIIIVARMISKTFQKEHAPVSH